MASNIEFYEYKIRNGDALSLIAQRMYGITPTSARYRELMDSMRLWNPHISDIHRIRAGDTLRLQMLPRAARRVPMGGVARPTPGGSKIYSHTNYFTNPVASRGIPQSPIVAPRIIEGTETEFHALSWLASHAQYATIPGSILLGGGENLLSGGNRALVEGVSDDYAAYKRGELTQNQYDYQRRKKIDQLRKNLGPMEKILYGDKTPNEVIRIARTGAVPTEPISKEVGRLANLASKAKHGGIVLTGVGVAASCYQIGQTDNRLEKNEIFVETVASTTAGVFAGIGVTLFLVSNPVGWGTALVIAAGTVAASYSAGKISQMAYTASGTKVDLVSGLGVDSVCK